MLVILLINVLCIITQHGKIGFHTFPKLTFQIPYAFFDSQFGISPIEFDLSHVMYT